MHQLFPKTYGAFLRILRNQSTIPKSLLPTSLFHSSDKTLISDSKLGFVLKEVEELQSLKPIEEISREKLEEEQSPSRNGRLELPSAEPKVHISHPWPEWMELMERLVKTGYFGGGGYPFDRDDIGMKDSNRIRTACLNFSRDRFDLIRYFCRKDIRVVVGSGCPSIDRKVVNSGKRLRAHVGIEEGNVCSSCSLRGSCERAYVKAREDEGGRTVDVMRILLTYGLDPITGSVENQTCLNKSIKESVTRLLNEMVEFSIKEFDSDALKDTTFKRISSMPEHSSQQQIGQINVPMKQGDWICPKCSFLNFAKNIKCLRCNGLFRERLVKLGEDQDHLPMKKGDWLCDKCNFLNFAKNTRCLQCKEKPTKRQLNPGEWECESCNYVNFKRNMACLKCDWKRPKASCYPGISAQILQGDGGFRQVQGMKFVRDDDEAYGQPSKRREKQYRRDDADSWRCVEDDVCQVDPSNEFEFQDFPIVGGRSAVSRNPQERERWKEEMSRRSINVPRPGENGDELSSASFKKRLEFLESTDDEEMAGWFGPEKRMETEKYKNVLEICRQ